MVVVDGWRLLTSSWVEKPLLGKSVSSLPGAYPLCSMEGEGGGGGGVNKSNGSHISHTVSSYVIGQLRLGSGGGGGGGGGDLNLKNSPPRSHI